MALVADEERRMISARTKAALAAAKARGRSLGGARGVVPSRDAGVFGRRMQASRSSERATDLAPIIAELRSEGMTSLGALARGLTSRGIPTARGGVTWTAMQVARVLDRLSSTPA